MLLADLMHRHYRFTQIPAAHRTKWHRVEDGCVMNVIEPICSTPNPVVLTAVSSLSSGVFCFSELFFIKEPHDVTAVRKEAVVLDCQAHGEAPIDVRWLRNGVRVVQSERVNLLSNGSLYIPEVESRRGDKSDEGVYQCLAHNKYGAILSQKARLTIASE